MLEQNTRAEAGKRSGGKLSLFIRGGDEICEQLPNKQHSGSRGFFSGQNFRHRVNGGVHQDHIQANNLGQRNQPILPWPRMFQTEPQQCAFFVFLQGQREGFSP